jgi:NitT/TauT family transport system substrate-binding protein
MRGNGEPPDRERRQLLRTGALAALSLGTGALLPRQASAEPLSELTIWGPPAGPSIIVLHAIAAGGLDAVARKPALRVWRSPDEMRAGLTSGAMRLGVMPTPSAANLFNRGVGVRLVNVMTNGLLYIVSADPSITGFGALRGKTLAALFPNETPSLILNRLLRHHGLEPGRDLQVNPTASPLEAMQLMLLGRADAALVSEPAASAAIMRGGIAGKTVTRAIDIQKEWGAMTGQPAVVPQAGLAVTDAFREAHGPLVDALHDALGKAAADVRANPARAANSAAGPLQMPWPVIEKSIAFSNLVAIRASKARASLEAMFSVAADGNAASIGGRLPDAAFYL